jgi:oxygen-independent coproporphyrinogen III oxidase
VKTGQLPIQKGLILSDDDLIRAHLITELMCNFKVNIADFENRWHIRFDEYFANELAELKAQREAEEKGTELSFTVLNDALQLTPVGQLFVRNVCMVFDTYLKNKVESRPLFSRTV